MNPFKILIVEDDFVLAGMYKERLQNEGYKIFTADNGEDALDEALAVKPDVVLLDLMLPKKGGLGVLQIIRSRPETSNTAVIILTNHPDPRYKEAAERYGIEDFIFKAQVMPKDVIAKINQTIDKIVEKRRSGQ